VVKIKGPNPFLPWEEDPKSIFGRKEEIRIFSSFANATGSKQSSGLLVSGGPGLGKTLLLRRFAYEAQKNGMLAPLVKVEKGEGEEAVVADISHELSVLSGAKDKKPGTFMELVEGTTKFGRFGAVIFIDDADQMKKADEALGRIAEAVKAAWGRKRVSFALSSTREFKTPEMFSLMRLGPFDEHDAKELVSKALGKGPPKMGEECLHSIMAGSRGNPRIFKSICRHIYDRIRDDEKVISKGHYLAYLPHIISMLSREWFGGMYQETPEAERKILQVLAKSDEGMHVSDIAKALRKPLGPITALTKGKPPILAEYASEFRDSGCISYHHRGLTVVVYS
jgi:hypothetical protein